MKHWALPKKYKCIAKIYAFPLCFNRRDEALRWIENDPVIQNCVSILEKITTTVDDIPADGTTEERCAVAEIVNGKEILLAVIGYVLMEKLGYDMGRNAPSKFFESYTIPHASSETEANTIVRQSYDIAGKLRAAVFDWGIYIRCNNLTEELHKYWYHDAKDCWMYDLRTVMRMVWD